MSTKKKLAFLILVSVILATIICISGWRFVQERRIISEINQISSLKDRIGTGEIGEILNRTVTHGKYAVVERAYKQYLTDHYKNAMEMSEIFSDQRISESLSIENFKKDGPEFVETKALLTELKAKLESCKNKYAEFCSKEKVVSYITDQALDRYYTDFYVNELVGDTPSTSKSVAQAADKIIRLMTMQEGILDFLSENKENWKIEDETIVFETDELAEEYTELLLELNELS